MWLIRVGGRSWPDHDDSDYHRAIFLFRWSRLALVRSESESSDSQSHWLSITSHRGILIS